MFPLRSANKQSAGAGVGSSDAAALLSRAPRLKDAAERIMAALVKSLQKMAINPMAITAKIHDFALRDMRDVATAHLSSAVVSLIRCNSVPCHIAATADSMLVFAIVDLLAGGNGRELPPTVPRDATAIDQQFAHIMFTQLAGAIDAEWAEFGFSPATPSKIENLAADLFGARVREIGCVDLSISIFGISGVLRLILPPPALDRFALEEATADPELPTSDALWSNQFRKELGGAAVKLDAYIDGKDIELSALAALKVGQVIALPSEARSRAALIAQGQLLFRGEIGQADNRYTLRIADVLADAKRAAGVTAPTTSFTPSEPLKV